MKKTILYSLVLLWFVCIFTAGTASAITSDDFKMPALNTSRWTVVNPGGDATITIIGNGTPDALLSIAVPAGTEHDVWFGNNAPRVMQSVGNTNFEIELKFQSQMTAQYQIQGVIIQQDSNNYLRFDFVKDSVNTRIFAASITSGTATGKYDLPITPGNPIYLRVKRIGDQWTQYYSYDGTSWITAANFNQALVVTSAGPYAGNAGNPAPSFTGLVDYFFNTTSPVVPEDAPLPPGITTQPMNRTVIVGQAAFFTVAATGTAPLSYQWQKDGGDIPGANSPSYTTPTVNQADNGSKYRVEVSNAYGSVTSNSATLLIIDEVPWWFCIPVTVNAAGFERSEKPVEVGLDFTRELGILGETGTFDENSIRVVETDTEGAVRNPDVPFQFDKDPDFNAATKASGTIVFIMNGTTQATGNRYYQVYFGLSGGSYTPIIVTPQVKLVDNIQDEGQSSYQIAASGSTYYFQKQAGGFSSLVDAQGNDWINYHPTPASSPGGDYRGIPNVYAGGIFHPGWTCCTSSIVTQGPLKIRVRSVSPDGKWESLWDFYPRYATMTMVKAGANYWWLYEGTPGGLLEPDKDFMVRSDNKKTPLSQSTLGTFDDIPTQEWAYFSDPTVNRSLFVTHHEDDTLADEYWSMPLGESLMTVFGFGRANNPQANLLSSVQHFTMGLMNGTEFGPSAKTVYSAYKDLSVTKGAIQQFSSTSPPIIVTQPANRIVASGTFATFGVSAAGQLPLSYQWQRNSADISGATSTSYTIPSTDSLDNADIYQVVVTNARGSVTSNPATLTVVSSSLNQVVLLDETYTHSTDFKAFTFFNLPPGIQGNLVSPVNFAQGTLYQRLVVITKPSAKPLQYGYCIFQDSTIPEKHACSDVRLLEFTGTGTYYADQPMTTLFQYGNMDWTRSFLTQMLVIKDRFGIPVDDRYGWDGQWDGSPDLGLYYPMQVRYTAIIVPPGGGAPIWPPDSPPGITTHPKSQTVIVGQTSTFGVVATGAQPLFYQWQKNGVNITGAYSSSYTTPPLTLIDTDSTFRVIVTNPIGSVISNETVLKVSNTINYISNPGFESGTASWTFYTMSGTGTFSTGPPSYEGLNSARLALGSSDTNMQLFQQGITLEPNTPYRLSFTAYSTRGDDIEVILFKLTPYTPYGLDYTANLGTSWQTFSTEFTTKGFGSTVNDGRLMFWLVPFATPGETYYIDNVILEKVSLLSLPSITIQPADQTVNIGQVATFSVAATGTSPLAYQWQRNGTNIAGATSASYTTPATTLLDNGSTFGVNVTNPAGSVISKNATMILTLPTAPGIITQPSNQTVPLGQAATFSVIANGTAPLTYQWQRNGTNIAGATSASYSTPTTTILDNSSTFRVNVTNPAGSVISKNATLTVMPATAINLLSNPGFESGLAPWSFYTDGAGTFRASSPGYGVSGSAANIVIGSTGSNIQLFQAGITLEPNTRYRLSFNAYSTIGHGVTVDLLKNIAPYSNYGLYKNFNNIGTSWQSFTTEFTTSGFTGTISDGRFRFWLAGNAAAGDTYYFDDVKLEKATFDTTLPNINIWYGKSQAFGQIGVPQRWINILGNAYDISGIASLNYSLNNGISQSLSIGPDGSRLQASGDFNIEINRTSFNCGNNQIVIKAVDSAGNMNSETVSVNYSCNNVWPRPYFLNWNNVADIQDAAQVVDGLWTKEQNSIRPAILGYDRLITIGDMTWDDYEVTVPITINTPIDPSIPYVNVGIIMRWQGHYDSNGRQPRDVWYPLGALAIYTWNPTVNGFRLGLYGNGLETIAQDTTGKQLIVGVPYMFKMRSQTIGTNTLYSLRVWEQGTIEPSNWLISGYGVPGELKKGSVVLVSHYVDASFGDVTVNSNNDSTPPVISNVISEVYEDSAIIRWNTNELASSNVSYGLSMAYQNGSVVDGAMVASHAVSLTGLMAGTTYHFKISSTDASGNSESTADMNFTTMLMLLPVITTQPMNRTVAVGQAATFTVVAQGTAPLTYQWQKNGSNIPGATGATYTTPATIPADNGSIFLVNVSNARGSIVSTNVTLTLIPPTPVSITIQPLNQTVTLGQAATFSVVAAGSAPLTYQWQKNGTNIAGAINSSYTTPATTLLDNGSTLRVNVTNPAGSVMSNDARVTVMPAASILKNPGFESGTANWAFYTNGIGSLSVSSPGNAGSNAAKVVLNSIGTNMQLFQDGVTLLPNTQYRLTFTAYSTKGDDVLVNLIKPSPYTPYGLSQTINLGTSWQTFTTVFTTSGFTGTVSDARFRYWLVGFANAGETYYFDEVRLEKI